MDRLPLGASFGDAFHALQSQQPQQQQQPTRAQRHPTQVQPIAASYEPTLPSGSEMPDEWGYPPPGVPQFSNIPRNTGTQGAVAVARPTGSVSRGTPQSQPAAASPTVPTCRYPDCYRRVDRDERTQELTEYCSLDHMRDAVQRFGFPLCPACKRCPRRSDSKFCGSLCEQWAVQQLQQQRPQSQQSQSQELVQKQCQQQQRHQQGHQQRQQHWQPSTTTMGPPTMVPNSSAVTWSNAARRSSFTSSNGTRDSSGWQGRYQQ